MHNDEFREIVREAQSAPSALNTQPARWRRKGDTILIGCDPAAMLKVSDPNGVAAGLACGAAAEATVLALSARRMGAGFTDLWAQDDRGCGLPRGSRSRRRPTPTLWQHSCPSVSRTVALISPARSTFMAGLAATRFSSPTRRGAAGWPRCMTGS